MFVRSNILSRDDIREALNDTRQEGFDIYTDEDGIRQFNARKFEHGFQFYCESLNGKRARNGRPGKAATWTAYGVFMAKLYKLDPTAEISFYKSAADFEDVTRQTATSPFAERNGYVAPWLEDETLLQAAADVR